MAEREEEDMELGEHTEDEEDYEEQIWNSNKFIWSFFSGHELIIQYNPRGRTSLSSITFISGTGEIFGCGHALINTLPFDNDTLEYFRNNWFNIYPSNKGFQVISSGNNFEMMINHRDLQIMIKDDFRKYPLFWFLKFCRFNRVNNPVLALIILFLITIKEK